MPIDLLSLLDVQQSDIFNEIAVPGIKGRFLHNGVGIDLNRIFTMNEKELLAALRVTGRYEVVTLENGTYIVIPMAPEAIMLTREAVSQCSGHFRKKSE